MQAFLKLVLQHIGLPLIQKGLVALRDLISQWLEERKNKKTDKAAQEILDAINKDNLSKDDVRKINSDLRKL